MRPFISLIRDPLIFLSSTSDLEAERDAVVHELRRVWQVYDYREELLAQVANKSPADRLREVLQRADVLIGILGPHYGTRLEIDGKSRSIVQWEFDEASRTPTILIYPFIKKVEDESTIEAEQRAFLAELQSFDGTWCRFFTTASELAGLALREMAACGEKRRQRLVGLFRTWAQRIAAPLVLVLFAAGAILLTVTIARAISPLWSIAAAVCLGSAIAMGYLLLTVLLKER